MSEQLKACPFCGNMYGDGKYAEGSGIVEQMTHWVCARCGASVPMNNDLQRLNEETDTYHPIDWNTRPLEDALSARLAIAVEALGAIDDFDFMAENFEGTRILDNTDYERKYFDFKDAARTALEKIKGDTGKAGEG